MSALLYGVHLAILPWLLVGLVRQAKACLANRVGPSIWQPLRDAAKLLRKQQTISETATWMFRSAPLVLVACVLMAGLMVPWLGVPAPLSGDLFLLVYVLALARFVTALAALDTGSPFGALGASREVSVSIQAELALVLALTALAVTARSSDLSHLFMPGPPVLLVPLLIVALWLAAMAELSRMPIDDPTTHLELTMIHEAMILENSGPNLMLVEYAAAVKLTVLLGLVGQVLLLAVPVASPPTAYGMSIGVVLLGAGAIVVTEATLVKLRWRRIPNLLSFGVLAATLACLLTALGGL